MKKYNYYLAVLIGLILFIYGCSKDKGNYVYKNLNTNFVDTTSIPKTFFVKQNDIINVDALNNPNSSGNLSYEWRLVQESYTPNPATGTYFDKQLSATKKLSYKVIEAPGNYVLVLYVKDNSNGGITQMVKSKFTISSYASAGWMVLHGNSTGSDISVLINNKLSDLLPPNTDYVQANLFSETNGTKIQGEGADVIYMPNHWVDAFTQNNQGGYRLSGNDFRIQNTYSDMFVNSLSSSEIKYEAYGGWGFNELLINKGNLYFIPQPTSNTYNRFGVKCFGEDYVAAPFIGTIFNFSYYGVFYDMKNERFLYVDYQRNVKQFKVPGATAKFDMRSVGKEMVYAEHGFDGRWFCLMQDDANPNTRELFVCKFNVADDGNRAVDRINISAATDLKDARFFSFGNKANVMYYATDSKIYQNNYSGSLASVLQYNVSASYPGSVITNMKLLKVANHRNDGKILYVALYNAATNEGTLLQIDVNEVSGAFGSIKAYTGFGKITGMNYKKK